MKSSICILLIVALLFALASTSMAAPETVMTATYEDEYTYIEDDTPPLDANVLPPTGGIPAQAFYALGVLFIIAAVIISRKKGTSKPR